jgi:hypothetical protein
MGKKVSTGNTGKLSYLLPKSSLQKRIAGNDHESGRDASSESAMLLQAQLASIQSPLYSSGWNNCANSNRKLALKYANVTLDSVKQAKSDALANNLIGWNRKKYRLSKMFRSF